MPMKENLTKVFGHEWLGNVGIIQKIDFVSEDIYVRDNSFSVEASKFAGVLKGSLFEQIHFG